MRYLIGTNIFIYAATDVDSLRDDVLEIVQDYDT